MSKDREGRDRRRIYVLCTCRNLSNKRGKRFVVVLCAYRLAEVGEDEEEEGGSGGGRNARENKTKTKAMLKAQSKIKQQ